jgi:tetraacyldisaccharide 4'-kinase
MLWPLSLVFSALVGIRLQLFRRGCLRSSASEVPVWVVGNVVVGGAGKTPTVLALHQWLVQQGRTPGIVSRGYGGRARGVQEVLPDSLAADVGDEPLLLKLRTQAPLFVGRDRVAAVQALLSTHPEVNIVISDDGLQHVRLKRDLQIIVFDARGAGNGWLLPAGPLRQPLPLKVPRRSVVVYNCPEASTPLPGYMVTSQLGGAVAWSAWRAGEPATAETLQILAVLSQQQTLWAAAGIAQPERFFSMLRKSGLNIQPLSLPDHHDFATPPWPLDATDVVITEKDAVKLKQTDHTHTRVWVVPLDLTWNGDLDLVLIEALHKSLRPRTLPRLH